MEEYPNNSNKYRTEQKTAYDKESKKEKIAPVATGSVKKKSTFDKITQSLIQKDFSEIKEYLVKDVLIPATKDLINKFVTNGISMMLYGDTIHSVKSSNGQSTVRYSYNNCYLQGTNQNQRANDQQRYNYDDILFETRGAAELVLGSLDEYIEKYGHASIADYYDAANISSRRYTDNNWGWTDLHCAEIVRIPEGYTIKFPKPCAL